jgi:polysaccharide biosynthesis protein PslJ
MSDAATLRAGEIREPLSPRATRVLAGFVGVAVILILVTSYTRTQATVTAALIAFLLILAAWRHVLLAWPTLLTLIVCVILFVPVRRYTVGAGLPFSLEPYRLLIALVLAAWLCALLVDPKTRFRPTGLEPPILALFGAIVASLAVNFGHVAALQGTVVKGLTFFVSFFFVMYFVSSSVKTKRSIDRLVMLIVAGGTFIAIAAVAEWKTGTNWFNGLDRLVPLLDAQELGQVTTPGRGDRVRAYASAQHSIALGAALAMIMPLAVYLYRRTHEYWWMAAAGILTFGALATGSRTAVIMLATTLVVFLRLKWRQTVRLLPLLLPLMMAVQVVMPGTLGTFRAVFFPKDGLVAEEQGEAGQTGSGRLADVGPSLEEWGRQPLFGQGFGTRLTTDSDGQVNAMILDDQWLSSLLELGAVGFVALLWLFLRATKRLRHRARTNDSPHGWLLTALSAAITAYAIGMITYDAFSFIQVTFLLFIVLGLAAAALRLPDGEARYQWQ